LVVVVVVNGLVVVVVVNGLVVVVVVNGFVVVVVVNGLVVVVVMITSQSGQSGLNKSKVSFNNKKLCLTSLC